MKEKDLVEFLSSTIEEDAIISRVYNLFHITRGYPIEELNIIVEHGKINGIFKIKSVKNANKKYSIVDWSPNNIEQEIIISDEYKGTIY